jgi:hypothetical protein
VSHLSSYCRSQGGEARSLRLLDALVLAKIPVVNLKDSLNQYLEASVE